MSTVSAPSIPSHLVSSSSAHTPQSRSKIPHTHTSSPQQPHATGPRSSSPKTSTTGMIDSDTLIRTHGGDVRKAMDAVVVERNTLLWKLVEKSRTQCVALASDVDRLRGDRDRANTRLAAAGLETVSGKKMSTSSSVMGLAIKPDHITQHQPRRNSDRDDRPPKSSLRVPPSPTASTQASVEPSFSQPSPGPSRSPTSDSPVQVTASPQTSPKPPAGLLPSLQVGSDVKARRESHMVFPPEVSSFMTLVESPKEAQHTIPAPERSMAFPVPRVSEPGPLRTPPPTTTAFAKSIETVPEEQSENRGLSSETEAGVASPPPRIASLASPAQPGRPPITPKASDSSLPPYRDSERVLDDNESTTTSSETRSFHEAKVDSLQVVRMTPTLLSHTRLSIPTSTVFPNALGRDVLCFIIAVTTRTPNAQPVTWTVAKLFSAFVELDTKIKAKSGKSRKELKAMVAPLPDGRAWKDFAPSKVDQRKQALEAYLQSLLIAPLVDKSDLCEFLNSDRVKARENTARKEGYLTKKGKNFGGWKTRYFVLDGPVMEYFETRGGSHLGSITITNAQIGRQNRPSESSDERDFRHAFLIIEQSKKGGQRHVLCAESDMERDSWIENLVRHVEPEPPAPVLSPPPPKTLVRSAPSPASSSSSGLKRSNSRKSSKDVVVTAAQPMADLQSVSDKFGGVPSPSLINSMESKRAAQAQLSSVPESASTASSPIIHTPTPQRIVTSVSTPFTKISSPIESLSSSPQDEVTPRPKRQSMMPGRAHSTQPQAHTAAYLKQVAAEGLTIPGMDARDKERDRKAKSGRFWPSFGKTPEKISRPVFGVPLAESIAVASKANLPAIVFRCIEYLEGKHAEIEEGLYRLSGSSAVIKGLKERFDNEGDVDLMKVDEGWDPHAIAGLLKTFLRELPSSLLTRDLHARFLAVMDLIDSSARVSELSKLVSELPPHNYALLRALTAHLILIVGNQAVNKMTLRNIGIVFSPTLGIPAGIFSEMVSHFGPIFDDEDDEPAVLEAELAPVEEDAEETVRRKRNSMLYQAGGADAMLGLSGRHLDPALEDSASEAETDLESEAASQASEDAHSSQPPPEGGYPSAAAARKAKAAARAADKGLTVEAPRLESLGQPLNSASGLPASPRPTVA